MITMFSKKILPRIYWVELITCELIYYLLKLKISLVITKDVIVVQKPTSHLFEYKYPAQYAFRRQKKKKKKLARSKRRNGPPWQEAVFIDLMPRLTTYCDTNHSTSCLIDPKYTETALQEKHFLGEQAPRYAPFPPFSNYKLVPWHSCYGKQFYFQLFCR